MRRPGAVGGIVPGRAGDGRRGGAADRRRSAGGGAGFAGGGVLGRRRLRRTRRRRCIAAPRRRPGGQARRRRRDRRRRGRRSASPGASTHCRSPANTPAVAQVFAAALARHVALVAAAVGPALAIGVPLGIAVAKLPRWQEPVFAVLNTLQTIPSMALFGLLIAPLSALATAVPALAALGVAGIGPAPAIIALVLYALLPVVRNTAAGIAGVDPAVIEAARGMGMSPRQMLARIEFPLAVPVLLVGLRIVVVQTIGLAVVAALIGAGGLGSFVFEGLGQDAIDLVLLGALPAILLALAADFVMHSLTALLPRAQP